MDISKYLNKLNDCKIIKDIKKYLARTIWVILAFIILGLCLSVQRSPFISHLGMGLVIAGIVGFYLEVFEVKKFVEERLAEVLTKDEYLESLNEKKLTDLILGAMKCLAKCKSFPFPINDDAYELDDFVDKIQGDAIEHLGAVYRKNFNEIIENAYCLSSEKVMVEVFKQA